MLWFLMVPAVVFFAIRSFWFGKYSLIDDAFDYIMTGFLAILLAVVTAAFAAGCAAITGIFFSTHAVEVSSRPLSAIRDKDGVVGSFFLGSGMFESRPYYFYYARAADGALRPGRVSATSNIRIYEEDRADASMTEWTWKLDASWAYLVALPVNEGGYAVDFHVPKGTVRTGYSM